MILRTLAIVFFVAALLTALYAGPGRTVGDVLYGMNASMLNGMESTLARYATPSIWNLLVFPFLSLPAWAGWMFPAGICFIAAALRPGRS